MGTQILQFVYFKSHHNQKQNKDKNIMLESSKKES